MTTMTALDSTTLLMGIGCTGRGCWGADRTSHTRSPVLPVPSHPSPSLPFHFSTVHPCTARSNTSNAQVLLLHTKVMFTRGPHPPSSTPIHRLGGGCPSSLFYPSIQLSILSTYFPILANSDNAWDFSPIHVPSTTSPQKRSPRPSSPTPSTLAISPQTPRTPAVRDSAGGLCGWYEAW